MRYQWVFAVVRDVQLLAGQLTDTGALSRQSARLLIQQLPAPRSPGEAAILRHLLLQIMKQVTNTSSSPAGRTTGATMCGRCTWSTTTNWQTFLNGVVGSLAAENHDLASPDQRLVESAKQRINREFRHPLSIMSVASDLGCHRRTLERAFRRVSVDTIHAYILRVRTNEAIRLLTTTDLKIEAVALEVGFRSRTSLQNAITKATGGYTPGQLRRHLIKYLRGLELP
jgi:AraC-like DNA-binding protein